MNPADKTWYDRIGITLATPYVVPTDPDATVTDEELQHLANVEELTRTLHEPAMLPL